MKAVNLLPHDLRRASKRASSAPEPAGGMGAYVVLGALALCVVALAGWVITTNAVKQRKADLASVTARKATVDKQAKALKPYADFDQMAQSRVTTVKGLVQARFDWPQALGDLSRVVPGTVTLQSLTGSMRSGSVTGGTSSNPLRGAIASPAVELAGCARSQTGVATMMSRLRGVDGVTRVSLAKSEKPSSTTGGAPTGSAEACGPKGPTFNVVAFFEKSSAAAQYVTPAAAVGATNQPPVPSAVDQGSDPTSKTGTPPAGSPAPAAGESSTTPASTSTTPAP
jgi:Tfp pilus assembly protein PilN